MAKFNVAYGLCPLIDCGSLLGVNVDKDVDCGIVTIGKNMVIRYKFQDQKVVSSWSTKDKLSSPVIYNSFLSEYTAVFNHDQLRMWKEEEEELDKVKKYKFQEPLHSVIPDSEGNCALVLFRCGQVATVVQALEARKEAITNPILSNNETIKDCTVITCNCVKYVAFTSCIDENVLFLNLVPVADTSSNSRYVLTCVNSRRSMVGYTIMSMNNSCCLLTLWSDGSLYSFQFLPDVSDKFPGVCLQKITSISTKHPVAITSISNCHLSFFGADRSEEGAMLVLFNLQYQLIQAKLYFKLYVKPPRIWNVSNHLLVTVGNNLIAVPYVLEVEQLSTLVGINSTPLLRMTKTSWDNSAPDNSVLSDFQHMMFTTVGARTRIKKLTSEGWPQAIVLQKVLPDILEKKDFENIVWCLKNFSDFPEHLVVRLLVFCFSLPNFPILPDSCDIDESKGLENGVSNSEDEASNPVKETGIITITDLVNAVWNVSVNDMHMIPHMRAVPFVMILKFLNYLSHLLDIESSVSPDRVIYWICLILDSRYQEYRLCQNEEVASVLKNINKKVNSKLEDVNDLKQLSTILQKLLQYKLPIQPAKVREKKYSVESLVLY